MSDLWAISEEDASEFLDEYLRDFFPLLLCLFPLCLERSVSTNEYEE